MSDHIENPAPCELFRDELAELALGILPGRDRSELLNHVNSCSRCSTELNELASVADTVLQLAPDTEPPLGFELRLVERLRNGTTLRSRHPWRVAALSVAALVVAILGFGLGTFTASHNGNTHGQNEPANLTAAHLTSAGRVLGEVMLSTGRPSWIFMAVDDGKWSGTVTCDVTTSTGHIETIGSFTLSAGYGAWGAPLTSPAGTVRTARLVASDGSILASARLSI